MTRYLGPSLVAETPTGRASHPIQDVSVAVAFGWLVEGMTPSFRREAWWYVEQGESA